MKFLGRRAQAAMDDAEAETKASMCHRETLSRVQAAEGQSLIATVKLTGECLPCPEKVFFFLHRDSDPRGHSQRESACGPSPVSS